ncbi:MAG: hypothetical protein EXS49_01255 [Candidatus Pacebacteria bacterium]|nr:hypothetical protein [Candidatus Paceibacterota bacterium]
MKYIQNFKNKIWPLLNSLFIFLSVVSIFINRRILLKSFSNIPHDYQSIFINFSDIAIILFLIYFLFYLALNKRIFSEFKDYIRHFKYLILIGLGFILFSKTSTLFSPIPIFSLVSLIRIYLIFLYSFSLGFLLSDRGLLKRFLILIVSFGVFNSLIATYQFFAFKSFGLQFIGEPVLSFLPGISKVAFPGTILIRGYGLFSHPNILGAYLFLCIMVCVYFIEKIVDNVIPAKAGIQKIIKLLLAEISLVLLVFGLVVSFSRSAILVSIVALAMFFFLKLRNSASSVIPAKAGIHKRIFGIFSIVFSIFIASFILGDIILPRFQGLVGSEAFVDRIKYSQMALQTIKQHPILGIGIGGGVSYFLKNNIYSMFGFNNSWQFEPVHNLYLIIMLEIGLFGLFFFLLFIFNLLIRISKLIFKKSDNKLALILCLSVLVGNLTLGIFDHYFWDSSSGILIFWTAITISLSIIFSNRQRKMQDIVY